MNLITGAQVPRTELVRHLNRVDTEIHNNVRSPEAEAVYGTPYYLSAHMPFVSDMRNYSDSTIGGMYTKCLDDQSRLARKMASPFGQGTWWPTAAAFAGMAGAVTAGCILSHLSSPLAVAGGAVLGLVSVVGLGWGVLTGSGPDLHEEFERTRHFESNLEKWGAWLGQEGGPPVMEMGTESTIVPMFGMAVFPKTR